MSLVWTDVLDIVVELSEAKPKVDPIFVSFVDLRQWILKLLDFPMTRTVAVKRF